MTKRQQTDHEARQRARARPDEQRAPRRDIEAADHDRGRETGRADEEGMSERELAGCAAGQVPGHREHAVDHRDNRHVVGVARAAEQRRRDRDQDRDRQQ
jgi:hypothetical protein